MTLFEKATPQLLNTLRELRDQYPITARDLEAALKSNKYWIDLRYGDVIDLQRAWILINNEVLDLSQESLKLFKI